MAEASRKADDRAAAPEAVAKAVAEETRQGYRGVVADDTPNEAYTVKGVTSGS